MPATNLWACCSAPAAGGCGKPTDETFQAPPPEDLKPLSTTATSSSTTAVVSTAGTSAPLVTTTLSSDYVAGRSGVSSGAEAGIAVGAFVGVLVLLALAFFLFRRRRRRHTINHGHRMEQELVSNPRADIGSIQELGTNHDVELDSGTRVESDSRTRAELELGGGVKVPLKEGRRKGGIGGVDIKLK